MTKTILEGITQLIVPTSRLSAGVLERASSSLLEPELTLVFIHGNVSSALFWQPVMLALPEGIRALAIDLRGFGASETLPVDATRGLGDFSDDVVAVLDELGITRAHLVGWSMGGGVVLQFLLENPGRVQSVTLESPVSPYGFGGTTGESGTRLTDDDAGTGAGGANPDFVASLQAGDRAADSPTSPRAVYQTAYVKPPFSSEFDDIWVESMLTTATGPANYPGESVPSANWPGFAPGVHGVLNTMAPQNFDASGIVGLDDKPAILWVRGADDVIVSDNSVFDLNFLGQLGVIPDWPGPDVAPAQPMVTQTRAVLDAYRAAGGEAIEIEFGECGHSPHLEYPEMFVASVTEHVTRVQSVADELDPSL